jgi:hypothetical protein
MVVMLAALGEDARAWHGLPGRIDHAPLDVDSRRQHQFDGVGADCQHRGLRWRPIGLDRQRAGRQIGEGRAPIGAGRGLAAHGTERFAGEIEADARRQVPARMADQDLQASRGLGSRYRLAPLPFLGDRFHRSADVGRHLTHGPATGLGHRLRDHRAAVEQ